MNGEFSNAYLADPESAGLLHAHNPEMKLLCCFRNPVDAAYAGFFQLSRVQPLPETGEETIARSTPGSSTITATITTCSRSCELFPRERILFLLFDDIKADPAGFYRRICEFLGIDASFVPPSLNQRVNPRMVLRSRRLRNLRGAVGGFLASSPTRRKLRAGLVRLGVVPMAVKLFSLNEKPGPFRPWRRRPAGASSIISATDNEALGELIGRDLSPWNA